MFDVNKDNSIKTTEREGRGEATGHVTGVAVRRYNSGSHLRRSASKTTLIKFLCQAWRYDTYPKKLGSKLLFITCGKECFNVTKDGSEVVDKLILTTAQEEANTRVLLYTKHASSSNRPMVIVTRHSLVYHLAFSIQSDKWHMFI